MDLSVLAGKASSKGKLSGVVVIVQFSEILFLPFLSSDGCIRHKRKTAFNSTAWREVRMTISQIQLPT
jgi:hypothetical protein